MRRFIQVERASPIANIWHQSQDKIPCIPRRDKDVSEIRRSSSMKDNVLLLSPSPTKEQDILPQKLLQKLHLRQEIHPLPVHFSGFHPRDFHLLDFHLHNFHLHQQTQTNSGFGEDYWLKVSSSPQDYSPTAKETPKENIIHFRRKEKTWNTLFVISRHLLQTPFIIVHSTTASSVLEIVSYLKSTFSADQRGWKQIGYPFRLSQKREWTPFHLTQSKISAKFSFNIR